MLREALLALCLVYIFDGSANTVRAQSLTDEEILDFSEILWDYDVLFNRMPDSEYSIDTALPNGDLFQSFNENYLDLPTYSALINLFDNYEPLIGDEEPVCDVCRIEEDLLLATMFEDDSPIMRELHAFLRTHGLAADSEEDFKEELKQYWFQFYSRGGPLDSSGFEHVFVGERDPDDNSVGGFHNWLQLYLEERDGHAEVQDVDDFCEPNQPLMPLTWYDDYKPITSVGLGNSPEYELAVLTLCFVSRPNQSCNIRKDGNVVPVQTWTMVDVSPTTVGSAYFVC